MLLLIFAPQPPPPSPEYINLALAMNDVYSALNASGPADLVFWTQAELFEYMDEGAQRLARVVGCFVERDTSITTVVNTGGYALPSEHISTIQVDLGGLVLRPRTVRELEALDASWPSTGGTSVAFLEDTQGLSQITLYPICDDTSAPQTLGIVLHFLPATISASNGLLSAPTVVREYFTFRAIAAARGKQSKAAMPDVADWFGGLADYMEQAMGELWGNAQ